MLLPFKGALQMSRFTYFTYFYLVREVRSSYGDELQK